MTEISNCAHCGEPMPEAEAVEYAASIESLTEVNPCLAESIQRLCWLCPRCLLAHDAANAAERRARDVSRLIERTYTEGLLPTSARACTFADSSPAIEDRNRELFNKARLSKTNLWVAGAPGTGKTFLARCVANKALDEYLSAAETTGIAINDLGQQFQHDKQTRPFLDVSVLILDDLDKPQWTNRGVELLWQILNHRMEAKKRVIVTSNTKPAEWRQLMAQYGHQSGTISSLIERLKPMQGLELSGASLRQKEFNYGEQDKKAV